MIAFNIRSLSLDLSIKKKWFLSLEKIVNKKTVSLLLLALTIISTAAFIIHFDAGNNLLYNDARSRLNIGRRVVEGLKPGLAQLGSVWLPLPHILMIPTIWVDGFWHTGFSGSLQSMISFISTGIVVYLLIKLLGGDIWSRIFGVFIFVANTNVLYMQSVAMTELLLMATMTWGVYFLAKWYVTDKVMYLITAAFFIMLSTLNRYDGWFLLAFASALVAIRTFLTKGYKQTEGAIILFCTLGGIGIGLWFLWNLLIFGDPLYFALGPFSAKAQQDQLEAAGVLITKNNLIMSLQVYWHALMYNATAFIALLGVFGGAMMMIDKKLKIELKIASLALAAPFFFNIVALYFGHSVLFIPDFSGSWFNVRYGLMLAPAFAVSIGYLFHRFVKLRFLLVGLCLFILSFMFLSNDVVTIDDAKVGSSGKNVSEVSNWLQRNAQDKPGFILISAASHDAIIFSSGLPMRRFIHEGTDAYWKAASVSPDRWARWIIMRTNDSNDLTWRAMSQTSGFQFYDKVDSYPFADIYQIRDDYLGQLNYEATITQK